MAVLQLLLVSGVLSTDFHYLLEHRHDEPACFAGAMGEEHYHIASDEHTCFIGYHSPTWIDQFSAPSSPVDHQEGQLPLAEKQDAWLSTFSFQYVFLRGPPAA